MEIPSTSGAAALTTSGGAPALRPLGLGEILDLSITLYRQNFGLLAAIAAVVAIPLALLQIPTVLLFANPTSMFTPTSDTTQLFASVMPFYLFTIVISILALIASVFESGALSAAISERYLGRTVTIKQAYGRSLRRWFAMLAASVIAGLIIYGIVIVYFLCYSLFTVGSLAGASALGSGTSNGAGGVAALLMTLLLCVGIVPMMLLMVFMSTRWGFVIESIVIEQLGPLRGLGRSWRLVKGNFWRVLFSIFLLGIFVSIITMIPVYTIQIALAVILPGSVIVLSIVSAVISGLIGVLVAPIRAAVMVLLYYDLRIRKEGFDLQQNLDQLTPITSLTAPQGNV